MAWCLTTTPGLYLNRWWLIINEVSGHSPEGNFAGNIQDIYPGLNHVVIILLMLDAVYTSLQCHTINVLVITQGIGVNKVVSIGSGNLSPGQHQVITRNNNDLIGEWTIHRDDLNVYESKSLKKRGICLWKRRLQNINHFVQASMCKTEFTDLDKTNKLKQYTDFSWHITCLYEYEFWQYWFFWSNTYN